MDLHLFDCYVADIEKKLGVDPFSRAFIFNSKYACERNAPVLMPEGERRTLLSLILERLNDDQWKDAFPGTFDLGSRLEVEAQRGTYQREDLADELGLDGLIVETSSFRTIENRIKEFTGQSFRSHLRWNSLKALKVLKLLFLIQRRRQNSFLRLISQVRPGKGSLEHRDRYPLFTKKNNEEQVWLLADLKSYLGLELAPERIRKVQVMMSGLLGRAEQQVNATEARLRVEHGGDLDAWSQAYNREISSLQESCRFVAVPEVTHDLDELMYVYVHALPFMHFAAESEQIVEKTLPTATITSVKREIEGLWLEFRLPDGSEAFSEHVQIADAAVFYKLGWDQQVRPIVEKATGHLIEAEKYDVLANRSVNLLARYFAYKQNTFEYESISVTLRSCVVAMCAVWQEMCNETTYRPFWMGQQRQGKRILGCLDESFLEQGSLLHQSYPEAIDQVWAQRFEWMTDAVHGRQEIGSLKAAYKVVVLKKLAASLTCLDIDKIERSMDEKFPRVQFVKMKVGVSQI